MKRITALKISALFSYKHLQHKQIKRLTPNNTKQFQCAEGRAAHKSSAMATGNLPPSIKPGGETGRVEPRQDSVEDQEKQ